MGTTKTLETKTVEISNIPRTHLRIKPKTNLKQSTHHKKPTIANGFRLLFMIKHDTILLLKKEEKGIWRMTLPDRLR